MKHNIFTFLIIAGSSLLVAQNVLAGAGHSDTKDKHANENTPTMGHMDENKSHGHGQWVDVPHAYEDKSGGMTWMNKSAIESGKSLYEANCMSCHGDSGKGDGPIASSLKHPPADLTQHLHKSDGSNDNYLFWRVSKGGTVDPFKEQDSMMPAFENILTETQRWQVLSYIHDSMHKGFKEENMMEMSMGDEH